MESITKIIKSVREQLKNNDEKEYFIVHTGLIMFMLNIIFEEDSLNIRKARVELT